MKKREMKITTDVIKERIFYLIAIGISIFFLFLFIGGVWIGHEAKRLCQEAKWEYQKTDCTEALIMTLDDENQGYRTRNHAIWALGQFGDNRALPALEKYYTGDIPDREPLDRMISQYELKKAIDLASGGTNVTSFLWKYFVDWE
jgi:hypothetical protein